MLSIEFAIKGVAPLMFNAEPPYEDNKGEKNGGKVDKNIQPAEIARRQLHTAVLAGSKEKVAVLPAHCLLKSIQAAQTFLPKTRKISMKTVINGGILIEPVNLKIDPQDWTIDSRRVPTANPGSGAARAPVLHRPRFDAWGMIGTCLYDERYINEESVRTLFDHSGQYIGLGTWRPQNRGPYGRFIVTKWEGGEE